MNTAENSKSLTAITGNYWIDAGIADDALLADISRGLLYLAQARYFATRFADSFTKNNTTPQQMKLMRDLSNILHRLQSESFPTSNGVIRLGSLRDQCVNQVQAYMEYEEKVTPMRDALMHGALTLDDERRLLLTHTSIGQKHLSVDEAMSFSTDCQQASLNAQAAVTNLTTLLSHLDGDGAEMLMDLRIDGHDIITKGSVQSFEPLRVVVNGPTLDLSGGEITGVYVS